MKRILLIFVAIFSYALTAMAENISPDVARQVAAKFLKAQGATLADEGEMSSRSSRRDITSEAPAYYVFNADAERGFVIVSGDDCVGDNLVLGYTEQGSFSTDNISANMQAWLDDVATQITIMANSGIKAQQVTVHDDIAPLVTSKWDQKFPYNAMCPMKEGGQSVTGCAATALAQVLYYHRCPQKAVVGPLPAYVNYKDGATEDELPSVTFDWDNMLDVYDGSATQEQCMAVATLMRYCGQLTRMAYSPIESSARYIDLDMLAHSFGYSVGATFAIAYNYGVQSWYDLLYNELREGRPLFYSATSTGGGHAFVVDGYKVDDGEPYFHVNWGWSGKSNGYYKLTLMNPNSHGTGSSATDDGYTNSQRACIGLQPATVSSDSYGLSLIGVDWNVMHNDIPHQMGVLNVAGHPATFLVAFAERQANGNIDLSRLYGEMTIETPTYDDVTLMDCARYFDLPENIASTLTAGTHNLTVVYKEAGTDAPWRELFGPTCTIEVTVKADGTAETPIYHPCPKFSAAATVISINGPMQTHLPHTVSATIDNSGDEAIRYIEFSAYLLNDGILTSREVHVKSAIFAEASTKTDMLFEGALFTTAGQYVGIIALQNDNPDFSGKTLDEVMAAPAYIGHTLTTIEPLSFTCQGVEYLGQQTNDDNMTIYSISCQLTNSTTMDYNSIMLAKIYSLTDDGSQELINLNGAGYATGLLDLAANAQGTGIIKFLDELHPGSYLVELQIYKDFQADPFTTMLDSYVTIATMPFSVSTTGITSIEDGRWKMEDVWHDLQGRKFAKKPTVPGMYIHNGNVVTIN